jgi:DNA-binding SARP family transcriptional activator/tetratricopeptide (TPR) repeat protein
MGISAEPIDDSVASELLAASAGHMASFLVLARYAALKGMAAIRDCSLPPSMGARLRLAAGSNLDAQAARGLFACALLGHGSSRELRDVLGDTPELGSIAEAMPLVSLRAQAGGGFEFSCHDLATATFCSREWAAEHVSGVEVVAQRSAQILEDRRDLVRLVRVLLEFLPSDIEACLERHGQSLLDRGLTDTLSAAMESVSVGSMLSRPRLIVLDASLRLTAGDSAEAERKASVARELARHVGDTDSEVEALTIIDAIRYWRGDLEASQESLESVLAVAGAKLAPSVELLVRSRLAMGAGQLGDLDAASQHTRRIEDLLRHVEPSDYSRVRAELRATLTESCLRGDHRQAIQRLTAILARPELPVSLRFELIQNAAGALIELGRVRSAARLILEAEQLENDHSFTHMAGALEGTQSCLDAARGCWADARAKSEASLSGFIETGDFLNANYHRIFHALLLAADGDTDSALNCSQDALEYFAARQVAVLTWEATLDVALCLVAIGDTASGRSQSQGVRSALRPGGYLRHELLADLVLAEADRVDGVVVDGVMRLAAQREYILSENANWTTAMVVRTLPGLLGTLAEGVRPERLPLHMLRMVGDDRLDEGLTIAGGWMDPERLASLTSHVSRARKGDVPAAPVGHPGCFVRMFGGLEVRTPEVGLVADSAWKKRKARMLFAMLVARRGQDVPRDVLFEYLWPDMDEDRARNNYYVILSAIKRATIGQAQRGKAHYVRATGSMCSIDTATVRSDLDDFDELLGAAREAEEHEDPGTAIRAYAQLMDVYRGDLLPGDVYDDWFAPLRERYRHEFSDAMLRAATMLIERDDPAGALRMLRRALAFDPWREDVYQATLRCQISSGQRSAAVETYVACRARLAEDLGLDPSAETRKLYETILAMEHDVEFA